MSVGRDEQYANLRVGDNFNVRGRLTAVQVRTNRLDSVEISSTAVDTDLLTISGVVLDDDTLASLAILDTLTPAELGFLSNMDQNVSTTSNVEFKNVTVTNSLTAPVISFTTVTATTVNATNLGGTLTTAAQPNVTSVGALTSLSVLGNISCNATIGTAGATLVGTLSTAAQPNVTSVGTLTSLTMGGNINGGANDFITTGTIGSASATLTGTLSTAAQPNVTSLGTLTSLTTSGDINVGANDVKSTGTVGGAGATLTGTLSTAAQPNITSIGTLTSLTTSGDINVGANDVISTGTIGSAGATLTGTISTAAQPSITSVGTLTGLSTSGDIDVGANDVKSTGTVGGVGATLTGTLSTAAQPNVTSLGTLTGLTTSGDIDVGANDVKSTGTVGGAGATLTGTLSTAAQPNVTSLGTLTSLTTSGDIDVGSNDVKSTGTVGGAGAVLTGTLSTAAQSNVTSLGTLTGLTMGGDLDANSNSIINLAAPSAGSDAATKTYVDSVAGSGFNPLEAARVATTADLSATYASGPKTLTGAMVAISIDDVSLSLNDRVLVKDQSTATENGVYDVTTVGDGSTQWVLTRSSDLDTSGEFANGTLVFVEEGTENALSSWSMINIGGGFVLDTNDVDFTQISGSQSVTAGNGLSFTGTTLNVGGTAGRISVGASTVDIDSSYVGQTTITTLGTISTGVWNGTVVDVMYGGTGAANATDARTNLSAQESNAKLTSIAGLSLSADEMLYTTGASTFAATSITSQARTLLADATAADQRSTLSAQESNAKLTSIAGLSLVADEMLYTTGVSTFDSTSITAVGRTFLAQATAANQRSTISAQESNAKLTSIAGLSLVADEMLYTTGASTFAGTSLTSQARTLLADATAADQRSTIGAQEDSTILTNIAGLSFVADKLIYSTGASTFATSTVTSYARTLLDDTDAATARTTLGIPGGTLVGSSIGSSTDTALAIFDGTGGDTIKQASQITVDTNGNMSTSNTIAGGLGTSVENNSSNASAVAKFEVINNSGVTGTFQVASSGASFAHMTTLTATSNLTVQPTLSGGRLYLGDNTNYTDSIVTIDRSASAFLTNGLRTNFTLANQSTGSAIHLLEGAMTASAAVTDLYGIRHTNDVQTTTGSITNYYNVHHDISVTGTPTVTNAYNIYATAPTMGSSLNYAAYLDGAVHVSGALTVGGAISGSTTGSFTGDVSMNDLTVVNIDSSGDIDADGELDITQDATLRSDLKVLGDATVTGVVTGQDVGTYIPTIASGTGYSGSGTFYFHYSRMGDEIHVTGTFGVSTPASSTVVEVTASLPSITTNFTATYQAGGAATCYRSTAAQDFGSGTVIATTGAQTVDIDIPLNYTTSAAQVLQVGVSFAYTYR